MRKYLKVIMIIVVFLVLVGTCGGYENDTVTTKQFLTVSALCLVYLGVSVRANKY